MPPDVVCRITQSQTPPENTSVAPACWVRGRLARMPGVQALRPHTAIHLITPAPPGCAGVSPAYSDAPPGYAGFQPAYRDTPPGCAGFQPAYRDTPPGCAGVQPACWEHGRPARIQRYTTWERGLPARLQRYATWVRGLPARMPGVQALRPHTAIHPITPAPPGCAGFQPACRVHRHCARIQRYTPSPLHRMGARASSPHAAS